MSFRPYLPLAVALAGCNTTTLTERQGELLVDQFPLEDLGAVPVAVPHFFALDLSADRADVNVTGVNVIGVGDSQTRFWTYRDWEAETGEQVPDDAPGREAGLAEKAALVATGDKVLFGFVYASPVSGYHQARITFNAGNGVDSVSVDVRVQAATPDVAIYPWTVDCGAVDVGSRRSTFLTIENRGDIPAAVTGNFQAADSSQFWTPEPDPVLIEPGVHYRYEVVCEPAVPGPQLVHVPFTLGDDGIGRVDIRVNDCENGVPAAYNRDGDAFTTCAGDCDDDRPEVHPGAVEVSDNLDNDCNGTVDDLTAGFDDDDDGYCDHPTSCLSDDDLPGDCNDGNRDINPGEDEEPCPDDGNPLCSDGIDNDCDGEADGGTEDVDGDGYTDVAGDCDPLDGTVAPGKPELPDGKDNDCDSTVDEGTVLFDDDGDGYCEGMQNRPAGLKPCSNVSYSGTGDCDDSVDPFGGDNPGSYVFPGAPETVPGDQTFYFGIDNDCDGDVDDGTSWADDDEDGYTEDAGDCNDANPNVGPFAVEVPGNGVDDDCNPATPASGPK